MTNPRRRLVGAYFLLIAVAAVIAIATEIAPRGRALESYGPNLIAEISGILATVLIVERLLAWQREREVAPLRDVAVRRVRRHLYSLLMFMAQTYKAAATAGSEEPYAPEDVVRCWDRDAWLLDFRTEAPVFPRQRWSVYAASVFESFETGMLSDLDRYAEVLGRNFVIATEDLLDDSLFSMMKYGPAIDRSDADMGFDRPRLNLYIQDKSIDSSVRGQFGARFLAVISAYDALAETPLRLVDGTWKEDSAPAWGAGRLAPTTSHSPRAE
jgi:hypothetical protein